MNNITQKITDRFPKHVQKYVLNTIGFLAFGYSISVDIAHFLDGDDNLTNDFQWALDWFLIIFMGTLIEGLFLFLILSIMYLVVMLFIHGYVFATPSIILFLGLYFGRKIYLHRKK